MTAYNLFRHSEKDELICAIPEDAPVLGFVRAPRWIFAGRIDTARSNPPPFDRSAAQESIKYNGYYLFQMVSSTMPSALAEESRIQTAADEYVPYFEHLPRKTLLRLQRPAMIEVG
ncbi:hypothetical protein [Methylobacterium oxalidis]|uniref:Uncharacterized protein n=1 Tax=Methylobacterium oxalidis TaxID=944322 RepID=A0A512JBJ3_9HYPH|nr:hypothetical protein [Methylobacterium oxalidis]GEP07332.1 hypothetical protein MOX02_53700 [Methylobacterium oxalidis]GJE35557.1 hypothetical protein LDDCCGHA_5776 [Methylobacterium oxalidis]GLS64472.1 hypothetical protein GCM10007888_28530 [Methylobacterium oxalidis]